MTISTQQDFPRLASVTRISKIPVVETGYHYATEFYTKVKMSNKLFAWSLSTAEANIWFAIEKALPTVALFEGPITAVDTLICRGLDKVEQRVPAITYPPELMYHMTKDYVSNNVVQPVLKRADSVKQLSFNGATKYGEMAATHLDTALDVADKYVDKYLPDLNDNSADTTDSCGTNDEGSKTVKTMKHINRLSRKLQRRLTRLTIAEAKALKQQSADSLQYLIYLADLLARDPKAFIEKARTLWSHLSEDEPENQVPPANVEQLIVMVIRESARRFVHLANFSGALLAKMPKRAVRNVQAMAHHINSLTDYTLKIVHLEGTKVTAIAQAKLQLIKVQALLTHIHAYNGHLLERLYAYLTAPTTSTNTAPAIEEKRDQNQKATKGDSKKRTKSPQTPKQKRKQSPTQVNGGSPPSTPPTPNGL